MSVPEGGGRALRGPTAEGSPQDSGGAVRASRASGPDWLLEEMRLCVQTLSGFLRPSASPGERRAAEWIAGRLREHGFQVSVQSETAHGGYWWPLGALNAAAAAAALARLLRPGRASTAGAVLAGGIGAAAIWDDVGGGRQWFRRAVMPRRLTWNVHAELGEPDAQKLIIVVSHHDAAHSGLVFHPALPRLAAKAFPKLHQRSTHSVPIMYGTWLGPVLTALGAAWGSRRMLRLGLAFALGASLAMADIARAEVVPGANDNLSAVAVLLALARSLEEEPVHGVRVWLLSTGSEESFMEGMQGFLRRHRDALDPDRTVVLCLECLGGPTLTLLEGEGMLRMRSYSEVDKAALARAAERAGVELMRRLSTVAATDALVAMRRGLRAVTLASVDETKFPANYHWPTDTPENLDWETMCDAFLLCERFLREQANLR